MSAGNYPYEYSVVTGALVRGLFGAQPVLQPTAIRFNWLIMVQHDTQHLGICIAFYEVC